MAPFAYMVSASFQPLEQMFRLPPQWIPEEPTIANYTGFFGSGRAIDRWVFNSVYVSTMNTVIILFFSSLIAYTFAKRTFPGRDFLFLLLRLLAGFRRRLRLCSVLPTAAMTQRTARLDEAPHERTVRKHIRG
jgi:ABC-type glycerol-3-phosphate transport system permease component